MARSNPRHRKRGTTIRGVFMHRLFSQLFIAAALAAAPPALAAPAPFGPAEQARALQQVEAQVRKSYVFPERRAAIVARLEAGAAKGRYQASDPVAFAQRVTEDMQ